MLLLTSSQWGEKRIIALLVVAAILLIAFIATQIMLPATATLPPRLFKNRTVVSALALFACMSSSNFVVSKYNHTIPLPHDGADKAQSTSSPSGSRPSQV